MDSACPEKDVTEILRDSDHSTKVAPTTLRKGTTEETVLASFHDRPINTVGSRLYVLVETQKFGRRTERDVPYRYK